MREAVIVSTARTPIGKAYRGAFNNIKSPTLLGHAIKSAVERAGIERDRVDDVVIGTVLSAGTAGMNVARYASLAAGLPDTVAAQTIDRQCSSGLMAIATAAKQIIVDGMDVTVGGGHENISAVQSVYFDWASKEGDPAVVARAKHAYMPMLHTAEFVAAKYGITREAQDEYALQSQRRTAAAQANGFFDAEIVPLPSRIAIIDKATKTTSYQNIILDKDEGNRPETTLASLQSLAPVIEGGVVTAGNASQLSDGASACVLVEGVLASRMGLAPLGAYRGIAVAGCPPEEMGIGPVCAIPKLLRQHGLTIDEIGLWELNEAFACQALYCRDALGIDPERYNVNGGGMGAAGLFEVL